MQLLDAAVGGEAAVDGDDYSGDEGGGGADEPEEGADEVFWSA